MTALATAQDRKRPKPARRARRKIRIPGRWERLELRIAAARPFFDEAQIGWVARAVSRILESGTLILGPYTAEFERRFREYVGVPHAVAVSSCTAALEIVLRFFGVEGGEVIVPTNTFVASANAVRFAGGTPVLADIDPRSLCLSPDDLERKLGPRTRAVIVVHIAGLVHPRMAAVRRLCRRRGVALIEDVAHATGAKYAGRFAGSFGDAGCFSFYPTKVITTGTGGMIVTPHKDLANFAVSLRHHGAGANGLTDVDRLGNDWLLDEIRAAVGVAQLRAIEGIVERRRRIASLYTRELRSDRRLRPLPCPARIRHVFYKYAVEMDRPELRSRVADLLRTRHGIETGSIYDPPVHRQPLYALDPSANGTSFPSADDILPRILCLPIHAKMSLADARRVVSALRLAVEEAGT